MLLTVFLKEIKFSLFLTFCFLASLPFLRKICDCSCLQLLWTLRSNSSIKLIHEFTFLRTLILIMYLWKKKKSEHSSSWSYLLVLYWKVNKRLLGFIYCLKKTFYVIYGKEIPPRRKLNDCWVSMCACKGTRDRVQLFAHIWISFDIFVRTDIVKVGLQIPSHFKHGYAGFSHFIHTKNNWKLIPQHSKLPDYIMMF